MIEENNTIYHEGLGMEIPLNVEKYKLRETKWDNKQKTALGEIICEVYSRDVHTIVSIVEYFGLNYQIWATWLNTVPKLKKKYEKAKKKAGKVRRGRLKEKALSGLEKLLDGHTARVVTVKRRTVPISRKDLTQEEINERDLNPLQEHEEIKKVMFEEVTEKGLYFPPNVKAIEITLINLDKESFERNPDPNSEQLGNMSIPIVEFIDPKEDEEEKVDKKETDKT